MPSIIDRIREWVHARTRSSEAGSDYDGFLSYSGEWHAIAVGAFFGLVTAITLRPEVAAFFVLAIMGASKVKSDHLRDAAKEVAYSGGAFVVLFALGFAVRVVVGF